MKKIIFIVSIVLMNFGFNINKSFANIELVKESESAILIEASTGKVLFEKNSTVERAPASMTKIMTMNLILNAIEEGNYSLNDQHVVSSNAASMGGSQVYLKTGEVMSVEELLKSIAIASANDSAVALAEKTAGSENLFVDMMNQKADELELNNTVFKNPTGLSEEGHYSTAKDMALLARDTINTYDDKILNYTSTYEDYIRNDEFWLVNTNKLVKYIEGVDGLKTGWTDEAGYCLTATMNLNGIRVIGVIMGSETSSIRNQEMTELLRYGVNNYKVDKIVEKGEILDSFNHLLIKSNNINMLIEEDIYYVYDKNEIKRDVELKIQFDEDKLFDKSVGKVVIYVNSIKYEEVSIILSEEVIKKSKMDLFKYLLNYIIN